MAGMALYGGKKPRPLSRQAGLQLWLATCSLIVDPEQVLGLSFPCSMRWGAHSSPGSYDSGLLQGLRALLYIKSSPQCLVYTLSTHEC